MRTPSHNVVKMHLEQCDGSSESGHLVGLCFRVAAAASVSKLWLVSARHATLHLPAAGVADPLLRRPGGGAASALQVNIHGAAAAGQPALRWRLPPRARTRHRLPHRPAGAELGAPSRHAIKAPRVVRIPI